MDVQLDLLPLRCTACGTTAAPTLAPGSGPHAAKALCGACGRFLKWLGRVETHAKDSHMGGIAHCTLVGMVGKYGVEVRYGTSGAPCASLTVVVSEQGSDGKTHDLYVPVEVWGKKAEAASELEPGQWVLFEGKLARRKKGEQWETIVSGFDLMPLVHPQPSLTGSAN